MGDISTEELTTEIHAILKTADLSVITAKKVREIVEKKLNCSLLPRKKEFDNIVMDFINSKNDSDPEDDDDDDNDPSVSEPDSSEEDTKKKAKKRPQPTPKKVPKKKKKSLNASDSGSESDGGSDSDYEVPKKTAPKRKSAGASGEKKGSGGRKSTGFTRAYTLSPELSELMGAQSLPRHEVVKKVWAIIKERNLYDPKNKQFAICDEALMKVMKVKRFRAFSMLKHLKPHFLD